MEIEDDFLQYEEISKSVRISVLNMIHKTGSPHIGPCFSIVEILVALYFKSLNTSPEAAVDPDRDRFILSKGHACPALYAVLSERGFMSREDLKGFAVNGGTLEQHPARDLSRGIEVSTGSLGHGLSVAAGMALAGRVDSKHYKVYVLLSDGELDEGSVWEAVMFAGHHKLANLTALVDYNRMQALGDTGDILGLEPLGEKWRAFGWHVQEIDGHDFRQIFDALSSLSTEKPNVLILHTVKGKGVSFMENQVLWHYRSPDEEEYEEALKELLQ
ncbi:MAG: transketolase [Nitrospirae bacterium]|nr:transketolase [Nitrospirota bacterium]